MVEPRLDYSLISSSPAPLFMGELPDDYRMAPASVIFNLCGVFPALSVPSPVIMTLAMTDSLELAYLPNREVIEGFCDAAAVYAEKQPTYWHCHAGLNRSGILVATYLHLKRGMRISDAIVSMRNARSPMVLCNNVFERTLRKWYGDPDEQAFSSFDLATYLRERVRRRESGSR